MSGGARRWDAAAYLRRSAASLLALGSQGAGITWARSYIHLRASLTGIALGGVIRVVKDNPPRRQDRGGGDERRQRVIRSLRPGLGNLIYGNGNAFPETRHYPP